MRALTCTLLPFFFLAAAAWAGEGEINAGKLGVLDLLRDPDSAKFKDVYEVYRPPVHSTCGTVNAKNAFGGYTGFLRFMATTNGEKTVVSIDPAMPETPDQRIFELLWNGNCIKPLTKSK